MAATFPGGVKTFSTKNAGDQIGSAHINDLQDEVVAVETELRKTSGSVVDHGGLAGLSNDDHPQYVKDAGTVTDNAIARYDGTDGRTIQNSDVIVDDNGNLVVDGTINVVSGVTTSGSSFPIYKASIYSGADEGAVWKRVALITIGTGLNTGANFRVEWIVGAGDWGQAQPIRYVYDVRCVRSGSVQDDTNAAYIVGNGTNLRVVKTSNGVFEVQVKSGYDLCRSQITINPITANGCTFDYGVTAVGTGTVYSATWNQANRVVTLNTPIVVYSNKSFTVNTTTTYDVTTFGIPATAKMVYVRAFSVWSVASADNNLTLNKYGTSNAWLITRAFVANVGSDTAGWVELDESGRFDVNCFGATTGAYCGATIFAYME